MSCENKLTASFLRTCSYKPKAGLENTVYLMNTSEIDKALTQLDSTVDGMAIKAPIIFATGAGLHKAEGAGKYPQGSTSMAQGDNGANWTHTLMVRILYYSATQRALLQKIIDGGRITPVIEKRDKGPVGELAFDVLGWESGLEVQTVEWSSNENEGVVTVTLATADGEFESTDRRSLVDGTGEGNTVAEWIVDSLVVPAP
jgi:hypothetical protein